MTVNLIRHGKTIANERRLYCGHTDLPLSENGVNELRMLKETVRYPEGDVFVTTGLSRAVSTLEILYGNRPYTSMPELMEYNFGDFEMKGYEELKTLDSYIYWIEHQNSSCPNGESKAEFTARVLCGLSKLKEMKGGEVVCICHGGVIVTIMESLFPGIKGFYDWQPQFGRGYAVCIGNDTEYYTI